MFKNLMMSIASLFSVICLSSPLAADVMIFFGGPDASKANLGTPTSTVTPVRDSFFSNLATFGIDDLESHTGPNPTLVFGSTGITGTTGFSNGVFILPTFSVSGTNFAWDAEGVADFIEFSEPITAFGAYIVQGGDGSSQPPNPIPPNQFGFRLENTLTGASKDIMIANLGPDAPFANVVFAGITDTTPFNRLSFLESFDGDGLLFDDFIAGQAVPEPTSLALTLAAAALIVGSCTRNRLPAKALQRIRALLERAK